MLCLKCIDFFFRLGLYFSRKCWSPFNWPITITHLLQFTVLQSIINIHHFSCMQSNFIIIQLWESNDIIFFSCSMCLFPLNLYICINFIAKCFRLLIQAFFLTFKCHQRCTIRTWVVPFQISDNTQTKKQKQKNRKYRYKQNNFIYLIWLVKSSTLWETKKRLTLHCVLWFLYSF